MALDLAMKERLDRFTALLLHWNATLNLIAARDAAVVWDRHITDSLQLVPLLPAGVTRGVDLGTGGGFPGLVLALATGIPFDLIEADRRKASFLRTAVLETGAPAFVHACRIEAADVAPASLVTARALAPLPRLLPLAARLLSVDGVCLFLKGAKADAELAEVRQRWRMTVTRFPSQTSADGVILRITELSAGLSPDAA
ncbi:16S rRNA (guanine(527)-N(7))-methyltransferase RsmG [Rhodopila sp.]|uniref:16S rRNA (guanine(527)-N(7))-methyltransferase RsmG n=1 Tax=Rhodopila sp. TaxID=2480087 RepID=UPI003D122022